MLKFNLNENPSEIKFNNNDVKLVRFLANRQEGDGDPPIIWAKPQGILRTYVDGVEMSLTDGVYRSATSEPGPFSFVGNIITGNNGSPIYYNDTIIFSSDYEYGSNNIYNVEDGWYNPIVYLTKKKSDLRDQFKIQMTADRVNKELVLSIQVPNINQPYIIALEQLKQRNPYDDDSDAIVNMPDRFIWNQNETQNSSFTIPSDYAEQTFNTRLIWYNNSNPLQDGFRYQLTYLLAYEGVQPTRYTVECVY